MPGSRKLLLSVDFSIGKKLRWNFKFLLQDVSFGRLDTRVPIVNYKTKEKKKILNANSGPLFKQMIGKSNRDNDESTFRSRTKEK